MAFECSDGSFSKVMAMITSIGYLVVELFGLNGCYEVLGNFVVKSLKCWNDSGLFELVVAKIVSNNEMVCLSAFDRRCKDCVAVIIV